MIIFASLLFVNDIILHITIHLGIILLLVIIFNHYYINVFDFIKKNNSILLFNCCTIPNGYYYIFMDI